MARQLRGTNADGGKSTLRIKSRDLTQTAFLEETDRKRKIEEKNLIPSCKKSLIRTGALNKQWKVNERVKERERKKKDRETETQKQRHRETERQRLRDR